MRLNIVISSDRYPVLPAINAVLQAVPPMPAELYCLCNESEFRQAENEAKSFKKHNPEISGKIFTYSDFDSVFSLANHFFLNASAGYLFFLSSNIYLEKDSLKRMMTCLEGEVQTAGVNPLLTAGWPGDLEERAAFMGLAFDYQKKLHYLYEGMLCSNSLANRRRFFQIAHPGCLLLRCADFAKSGGFRKELEFLAFPSLCLQISGFRVHGFTCLSGARGRLQDKFDSWSYCGAWNSILQRGRLTTENIKADYAGFCMQDGISYGCDNWLAEGPAEIPDKSDVLPVKCWQEWRYHPGPQSLLAFLFSLLEKERVYAIDLARNRPASLPQTLQYYKVQSEKLKAAAEGHVTIAEQISRWLSKIRRFHYGELKPGMELLKNAGIYNCALDICPAVFDAWVETAEKFERLEPGDAQPEIAVVMPVWNPRPEFLIQAIESVIKQTYSSWRLCIADDASSKSEIRPILEGFARDYERISVKFRDSNGHICRASNTALEMVSAPYTSFLDHDDLLSPHALCEVARYIVNKPDLGFIYTDDDRINEYNVRRSPVFRPDFDCDLFFTGHLSTYDTNLVRKIGGLRPGTEGSQDQDLRFRVTELLDDSRIAHIPKILYHWRVHEESTASSFLAKPYVIESGKKVYLDAASRQGRQAVWWDKSSRRLLRLLYYPQKRWHCAVILLVGDSQPSLDLLETIKELKKYADTEIYLQPLHENSPMLQCGANLPYTGGGIANLCNSAAEKAAGDVLLFLSAELEPDMDCRLEQLIELVLAPHVAMAGGNIWHGEKLFSGGWYPNADGMPFLLLQGMNKNQVKKSAWGQMYLPRHVLGAHWQCMAVKKEICRHGKFLNEEYGIFATVDFGLRAMKDHKYIVMNPWVNWQTDKLPVFPDNEETKYLLDRWKEEIASCGLRNPNLRAAPDMDWTINL